MICPLTWVILKRIVLYEALSSPLFVYYTMNVNAEIELAIDGGNLLVREVINTILKSAITISKKSSQYRCGTPEQLLAAAQLYIPGELFRTCRKPKHGILQWLAKEPTHHPASCTVRWSSKRATVENLPLWVDIFGSSNEGGDEAGLR